MTTGIVAPQSSGFLAGLNTAFSTGARHKLAEGAVVYEAGAVHVAIHPGGSQSVSTQIAALRALLLGETSGDLQTWFSKIKLVRTSCTYLSRTLASNHMYVHTNTESAGRDTARCRGVQRRHHRVHNRSEGRGRE